MSLDAALPLLVALPYAGAALVIAAGRWPNLREAVSLATAIALFAGVIACVPQVAAGARPACNLLEIVPGISLAFALEPLGLIFALVASGLWVLTTLYAIGYMRANGEGHQTRFFACFALALGAAMGIALAANLVTLFVFYEALTLSTYPLVTHKGDAASRRSGRIYLGILLTTSIGLLLPAIVVTYMTTGSVTFTPGGILAGHISRSGAAALYVLFLFGIGKAALMPLQRWLPAAMVAPTPVSALLHAVAVVKAGVFTVLKVTIYIFGLDFARRANATEVMMWVAAATLLGASLVALTRDNLKERLAYSTVSQLAYIVLGATLATTLGAVGGALHIVMHAVGKITLFFCAGAIYTAAHKTRVSELNGLGRTMPLTCGAFLIAAVSIIGLPPAGGTWSKWYLMAASWDAGHPILIAVLAISSLLNIAYLLPIPARAFFLPAATTGGMREAPWPCVVPLCVTALGSVVLFFTAGPIVALLQTMFTG